MVLYYYVVTYPFLIRNDSELSVLNCIYSILSTLLSQIDKKIAAIDKRVYHVTYRCSNFFFFSFFHLKEDSPSVAILKRNNPFFLSRIIR